MIAGKLLGATDLYSQTKEQQAAGLLCGKVKEGETINDLFAFLTPDANKEVGEVHPKAMPVILATQDEVE